MIVKRDINIDRLIKKNMGKFFDDIYGQKYQIVGFRNSLDFPVLVYNPKMYLNELHSDDKLIIKPIGKLVKRHYCGYGKNILNTAYAKRNILNNIDDFK